MARKSKAVLEFARPIPPESLFEPMAPHQFIPAPEVKVWSFEQFVLEGGDLHNPDHAHLQFAEVVFLWAANGFNKQGRAVLGQCEDVTFRCGPWQKGRQEQQMRDWFDLVPDFLITLDASYCAQCSDLEFCALVEHELYHIGQTLDDTGQPAFSKDGQPKLSMRAHDVEEFIGVVRRYGPSKDVAKMIDAAKTSPEVATTNIARACGTCLLRAA
ncbi:putative metallopeptidase [Undibacterium sp. TJN19]|uniref:putative metallopeptidase n=1 Tax=Undibacterium sp. TJN19 TaxID=3413055 RepID=UPI003BF32718